MIFCWINFLLLASVVEAKRRWPFKQGYWIVRQHHLHHSAFLDIFLSLSLSLWLLLFALFRSNPKKKIKSDHDGFYNLLNSSLQVSTSIHWVDFSLCAAARIGSQALPFLLSHARNRPRAEGRDFSRDFRISIVSTPPATSRSSGWRIRNDLKL